MARESVNFTIVSTSPVRYIDRIERMASNFWRRSTVPRSSGFAYLVEEYYSDLFYHDSVAMGPTLLRPKSRGSITLRSTDPFDQPNIDPNFLADPEDLEFFVRASRFCVEILETNAMKSVGAKLHDK
ncbi:Glucose dehydrogenase [FAD, quinone], partial [Armadillidium vulgare]